MMINDLIGKQWAADEGAGKLKSHTRNALKEKLIDVMHLKCDFAFLVDSRILLSFNCILINCKTHFSLLQINRRCHRWRLERTRSSPKHSMHRLRPGKKKYNHIKLPKVCSKSPLSVAVSKCNLINAHGFWHIYKWTPASSFSPLFSSLNSLFYLYCKECKLSIARIFITGVHTLIFGFIILFYFLVLRFMTKDLKTAKRINNIFIFTLTTHHVRVLKTLFWFPHSPQKNENENEIYYLCSFILMHFSLFFA